MSKSRLGLVGQTATYEATGPYVDGLGSGTAITGHRTCATAYAAGDLPNGKPVILLIEDASGNRALWKATYDNSGARFARVSELTVIGSAISDEAAVSVYIADVYPDDVTDLAGLQFLQALNFGAFI